MKRKLMRGLVLAALVSGATRAQAADCLAQAEHIRAAVEHALQSDSATRSEIVGIHFGWTCGNTEEVTLLTVSNKVGTVAKNVFQSSRNGGADYAVFVNPRGSRTIAAHVQRGASFCDDGRVFLQIGGVLEQCR